MDIVLVDKPISRELLLEMAQEQFGDMVKAVVDIEKGLMALGGELHVDEESHLFEKGQNKKIFGASTSTQTVRSQKSSSSTLSLTFGQGKTIRRVTLKMLQRGTR